MCIRDRLFDPPNVAGWGTNGYWLSTATMWARARFATNRRWVVAGSSDFLSELQDMEPAEGTARLLQAFRIHEPSANTISAVEEWFRTTQETNRWALSTIGMSVAALTPEFQVV